MEGLAKVLVVDDEPSTVGLLRRLLAREGYTVVGAASGKEALEAVQREQPDLVVLDVVLPDLDGLEVCRRIKDEPITHLLPIILVTGTSDRVAGIDAGADEFLRKPFDPSELLARVRSLVSIKRYTDDLDSAESVIISLALTIEARDPYTDGHCQRLARYASALAQRLALPENDRAALQRAGFLHDIGKVAVPDAILFKPAQLTRDEFHIIKGHAVVGDKLCGELRLLAPVRPIVRSHHERLDASGYPDGLHGDDVPLLAQILAIVDVYDAVTTTRPYRVAWTPVRAFEELEREAAIGKHDRELVRQFVALAESGGLTLPAPS